MDEVDFTLIENLAQNAAEEVSYMKNSSKFTRIAIGVIALILLLGSFPVKMYYGQQYCDVMRVTGFVLLFIYLGMNVWASKK